MKQITPPPLQKGDTIGVMAPSSFITREDVEASKAIIESYGYNVHIHPQTYDVLNQSAGLNEAKRDAFHDLIKNPKIKAIVFACGGNRAMHWVDMIDFDLVKANPKIIMGFSDCTVPLNIISARTGLVTYHGPTLRWFMVHEDNKQDIEQCFDVLSYNFPAKAGIQNSNKKNWIPDQVGDINLDGVLIGGNVSLFQYLLDDIDYKDKILFLEGWNTEWSYLDRTFCAMKRHGAFDQIKGLLIGQFDNMMDTGRPYGFEMDAILAEHVPTSVPVFRDLPFGHGKRLITLPIGQEVDITIQNDNIVIASE
jgi:muramoyltetrapeptide carboxypeptidase